MAKKKVTKKKTIRKKTQTKKKVVKNNKHRVGKKIQYASAPESTSIVSIKKSYDLFIDGKWVTPKKKNYEKSVNPSNGKKLFDYAVGTKEDIDLAVKAARKSYEQGWGELSPKERGKYLFRLARIIQERSRELSVLESLDGGKPIKESRDVDIPLVAQHFFYYAGWADKLEYAIPGKKVESLGVCGQIIPWNFPLLMAAWKLAPALACGNTVVLKPAETTPLTSLVLAEMIEEAGFPPGTINIVTGAGETGQTLVDHPDVNKLAFTGSTNIGKKIASSLSDSHKKVTLELGGKSANIVFEDAAIDQAIEGVIAGIYFNQGHVCCAGSRLLIEESIKEQFLKKLRKRMSTIRVGDPLDKNTDMGAINSKMQLNKIKSIVDQAKKEAGSFFEADVDLPKEGYFYPPCYFEGVSTSSLVATEEVFGPVLAIMTFRTPDEAIQKANDTNFGLACGIWSEKGSKIHYVASKIKAGVIWANTYNKFDAASPFGGYKESGWGREGGKQGLFPYLKISGEELVYEN